MLQFNNYMYSANEVPKIGNLIKQSRCSFISSFIHIFMQKNSNGLCKGKTHTLKICIGDEMIDFLETWVLCLSEWNCFGNNVSQTVVELTSLTCELAFLSTRFGVFKIINGPCSKRAWVGDGSKRGGINSPEMPMYFTNHTSISKTHLSCHLLWTVSHWS